MLMYLGRYACQSAVDLEREKTTVDLLRWVDKVHEFLEEERRQVEQAQAKRK